MSPADADGRDPGLAAERTDLAWSRSALPLLACGVVALRGVARPWNLRADVVAGVGMLVLGAATFALGMWHRHRRRRRGDAATTPADLLPLALGTGVVGVAAFFFALVGPG